MNALSFRLQFLIGTLKTLTIYTQCKGEEKFQFLIGTLKTLVTELVTKLQDSVSIPDRYAKNHRSKRAAGLPGKKVSIPDRYAKNRAPSVPVR